MSDMEMSDLLGLFIEEAEEQLQKLDDGILHLEKNPDDAETLNEVFRAAHTLKGSAGTMGLTEIAELTHAAESLLDSLRNGAVAPTREIIDLLLETVDAVRILTSQASRGEAMQLDTDHLLVGLRSACPTTSSSPEAPQSKEQDNHRADRAAADASEKMTLKLKVAQDCLMPSVRAFMIYNALSGLGDVVTASPVQDNLDDIQAGQEIEIVFAPAQDADAVLDALRKLSEVELVGYKLPGQPSPEGAESAPKASGKTESGGEPGAKGIQTVRVGVDRLDTLMNLVAELVIDRNRISQLETDLAAKYESDELIHAVGETAAHIGRVVTELQEHIMQVRLLPVEQVFSRFPRMVRDLARKAGKQIDLVLEGQETELDRSILEGIVDPLTHLLRNSVDHGIETPEQRAAAAKPSTGRVVLAAKQEENRIILEVEDDGGGIPVQKVRAAALKKGVVSEEVLSQMTDEDTLQLIFAAGLSTAEKVTDVSGRGVGMDVVRTNIQGLSGSVEVYTEVGKGTKFRISLPLTLATIQALVTGVEDHILAIPLSAVVETHRCDTREIRCIDRRPAINFRGSVLPLVKLGALFDESGTLALHESDDITFVVVNTGGTTVGFVVDQLIGEHEVVIKPIGSFFGDAAGIAGATILGNGRVALIVDVAGLGSLVNRRKLVRKAAASA